MRTRAFESHSVRADYLVLYSMLCKGEGPFSSGVSHSIFRLR